MRTRTIVAATAMSVAALTLTTMGGSVAHADEDPYVLDVSYDAQGTSVVAKTGGSVELGPTTLSVHVRPDGTFTGELPLPPRQTTFAVLGLLPVSATVSFLPVGDGVDGVLAPGRVTSTAHVVLQLSDVTVAGLPTPVGDSCRTAETVDIPASTPAGEKFDLTKGGTLAGTYTIGAFENCGLTTALINLLVPGPGNTQTILVSNGRLG